jgi:hypothetical protein
MNRSTTRGITEFLAWFSIGLGVTELVAAKPLASYLGIEGKENLIRAFGAREITAGIGLLSGRSTDKWMWGRVAGDVLDMAVLAGAMNSGKTANALTATMSVAPIVALDVICAQQLSAGA